MTESRSERQVANSSKIVITWDDITPRSPDAKGPMLTKETATVCGICLSAFVGDEPQVVCSGCALRCHDECWRENFGCAAYGCSQVNVLKPGPDIRVVAETAESRAPQAYGNAAPKYEQGYKNWMESLGVLVRLVFNPEVDGRNSERSKTFRET